MKHNIKISEFKKIIKNLENFEFKTNKIYSIDFCNSVDPYLLEKELKRKMTKDWKYRKINRIINNKVPICLNPIDKNKFVYNYKLISSYIWTAIDIKYDRKVSRICIIYLSCPCSL